VLARNVASLVTAGTEKHMLEMVKKFLVGRVLARPGLVHLVAFGLFHFVGEKTYVRKWAIDGRRPAM